MKHPEEFRHLRFSFIGIFILTIGPQLLKAQSDNKYLPDKSGSWKIESNSASCMNAAEKAVFDKKLTSMAEWFHRTNPMLASPKGFDMEVDLWKPCDHDFDKQKYNFGYHAEVEFLFQLFSIQKGKETKWVVEPPHWKIRVNNTTSGHGPNFTQYGGYQVQVDDPKNEAALDEATRRLGELFAVFEKVKEFAPGVTLYGDGNLVVANPERPFYWLPVTVREVLGLKLALYKIRPQDKMVYDYVNTAFQALSREILDSPACLGSEDGILDVNGNNQGPPIMRFNNAYWDKTLPKTAIQLMTMYYLPHNEDAMLEHAANNGYPDYIQMVMDGINLPELISFIDKHK